MKTNVALLVIYLSINLPTFSQITSTFNSSVDGWTVSDINQAGSETVSHVATGGNPGGYASSPITSYKYWTSPAKFTTDYAYWSYGLKLKFDLQVNGTPNQHGVSYGDVIIRKSNGSMLVCNLTSFPAVAPAWTSYEITLDESTNWRLGSINGAVATKAEIIDFLTNLASIRINAQYGSTTLAGLDNVLVEQRTLTPAPSITTVSSLSGKAGESLIINGTGFSSTPANNQVHFGSICATVTQASTTQLTVTIPTGAPYAYITVVNTITGLSISSVNPFIPLFEGGGRIIRDSFKDEFVMTTTSSSDTKAGVADVDGDGWTDLLFSEPSLQAITVMRNKGLGGIISPSSFETKIPLALGRGGKVFFKLADFDGDGRVDIAFGTGNGFYSYFGWLKNTSSPGSISFAAPEELLSFGYIDGPIHIVDIDLDGLPDVVALWNNSCGGSGTYVGVFHNASTPGNIEFSSHVDFDFNILCVSTAVSSGDLNGDGKPELLVTNGFGGQCHLFENNSTPGTIHFLTPFAITNSVNESIQIADFNNDGKNDIAWKQGYSNDDVKIRLNEHTSGALTTSSFGSEIILDTDLWTYGAISIGDPNGDGKVDILASDASRIAIFENVFAGGTFDATSMVKAYVLGNSSALTYPNAIITADLNRDNKPDLIAESNDANRSVFIFENRNIRSPRISLNTISPLKGAASSTVTITGNDFSPTPANNLVRFGTIKANVLAATTTTLTVEVPAGANQSYISVTRDYLTSQYDLPFGTTFGPGVSFDATSFAPPVSFVLTTAAYDLDAGDLNNDGKPDVIAQGNAARSYAFTNMHTSGTITTSSLTPTDTTNSNAQNLRIVDINSDGKADLATANGIYRNTSSTTNIEFDNLVNVNGGATNISFQDFNGDGKTDLFGINSLAILAYVFENISKPGPFLSDDLFGTLKNGQSINRSGTGGATLTGDFDRDGYIDAITTNGSSDNMTVFKNNGGFRAMPSSFNTQDIATGDNPALIRAADFDGDGKLDLIVNYGSGTSSATLTVFQNQSTIGSIAFIATTLTVGSNTTSIDVSDLDGDGKPDILATSESTDQFFIIKNNATAGAITASSFATPFATPVTNPRGITTGDINLDNKPEILITSAPNTLLVYENLVATGPVITITQQASDDAVCEGETATFAVEANGTTNIIYQWQFSPNTGVFAAIADGTGYAGAATKQLSINTTGNFGEGQYRCVISGDDVTSVTSADADLIINDVPAAPTTAGDTDCVPAALTLTATGGTNGNYRWYDVSSGGVPIAGQVNSTFTTPVLSASTTYFVSIVSGLCESLRASVDASINPLAKPTLNASEPLVSGTVTLCDGESLTITGPAGFSTYTWSTGAGTQQITVNTSGTFSLHVEDASGCISPSSDEVTVAVNPYPVAEITVNGTVLTASPGDSHQWYQNSNAISGATSQSLEFNVLEYGVYQVDVTENGCTTASDEFTYFITGSEQDVNVWKIYPNPFTTQLIIESSVNSHTTLELTDALGKSVKKEAHWNGLPLDLNGLQPGIYIINLSTAKQKIQVRVTKKQ